MHRIKKFIRTLQAAYRLIVIRTTGEYKNSFWDGESEYHTYLYQGKYFNLISEEKP